MNLPEAEDLAESGGWDLLELSDMMSLLQRAEQRMRKLDPPRKQPLRAAKLDKYA